MTDSLLYALPMVMLAAVTVGVFWGYPVALLLGGLGLIFAAIGQYLGGFNWVELHNIWPRMWSGVAADPVMVSLPMFILMGTLLERSGVASEMLRCTQLLMGRLPGGLAIAVAFIGTILAAPIGVVGASVVLLAVVSLNPMLRQGYDKKLALGTVAATGTLGILIPPSVMLVVMAEVMNISLGALFAAATIPGLVLAILYLGYILSVALLFPDRAPVVRAEDAPQSVGELVSLLMRGFVPISVLIAVVLGSIFLGWATSTEAAAVGVLGALLLAFFNRKLSRHTLYGSIRDAAFANGMIFMIFLGATLFSYVFRSLGGDDVMMDMLHALGITGRWEILMFFMVTVFVLGFPFEWTEICLIVLPIFVPILEMLDFSDIVGDGRGPLMVWLAILVAVNLQTAFMTPPFGATLFYLKGVSPANVTTGDIFRGMTPFVILQLVGLLLCMLFPGLILWLPRLAGMI